MDKIVKRFGSSKSKTREKSESRFASVKRNSAIKTDNKSSQLKKSTCFQSIQNRLENKIDKVTSMKHRTATAKDKYKVKNSKKISHMY